jgi:AcrR family transcriptional regulator
MPIRRGRSGRADDAEGGRAKEDIITPESVRSAPTPEWRGHQRHPQVPFHHRQTDSIWTRPERPARGQRQALDRAQIVRAAIAIADEEGPQELSMRRIARRLGVGAMSLYWYVASKEELLDLVFDAVLGEEPVPTHHSGDWRADLTLLARRGRAMMLRHPWLPSLMHVASRLGPNALAHADFSLATVDGLGLDTLTSFSIPNAVDDYVRGAVLGELEWAAFKERAGQGDAGWPAILSSYREQAGQSGRYPALARHFSEIKDVDAEANFEFGLSCLLDGIAARIAARR